MNDNDPNVEPEALSERIRCTITRLETENRLLMQARVEERPEGETMWLKAREKTRERLAELLVEAGIYEKETN